MKKCYKVLVSGASGIVGYGILKSLNSYNCKTVGTTIYDNSVAPYFCDHLEKISPTDNPDYIKNLINAINKNNVDIIIPSIEIDVLKWSNNRKEIEQNTNAITVLNNPDLIKLCSDKWMFYKELNKYNSIYKIPTYSKLPKKVDFPIVIKPKKGYGSNGIFRIYNEIDLAMNENKINNDIIIQPLIGSEDQEYTVSGFFDKESNLMAFITLKRNLSKMGYTESAETVDNSDMFEKAILDLALIFKPVGPTNFQFRIDKNNELKLLEINPRISSSTSIRSAFGFNESIMCIEYFLEGKKITQPKLKKGRVIRYSEDAVFLA
jgi:carbamoyl-phosphate synthase large subunit